MAAEQEVSRRADRHLTRRSASRVAAKELRRTICPRLPSGNAATAELGGDVAPLLL